jgi:hypothetical protein
VDGSNTYQVSYSSPLIHTDPTGLAAADPKDGDVVWGTICTKTVFNCQRQGDVKISLSLNIRKDVKGGVKGKIFTFEVAVGISATVTMEMTVKPCSAAALCADYTKTYRCNERWLTIAITSMGPTINIKLADKCGWDVSVTGVGARAMPVPPDCCPQEIACRPAEDKYPYITNSM